MQKRILVSVDSYETQVAVFENSTLAEYFFERNDSARMAGNIYKGRVSSIIPGIDAAFVDIGLQRNAFLYVNDALSFPHGYDELIDDEEEPDHDNNGSELQEETPPRRPLPEVSIRDVLKEGQEILVQMQKEPIGTKGSRVTANLSLPGRFLVLLPSTPHIGVSRKIEQVEERERLRAIAEGLVENGMGMIIRTAAEGLDQKQLAADYNFLVRQYRDIQRRFETTRPPALLHRDLSIAQRVVRDVFTDEVREFIVDDVETFQEVVEFAQIAAPDLTGRITLYQKNVPLFDAAGVEAELRQLTRKRIWLACGGYIVIDESEALTAIDVNTGRYLGKHNLEETVYHTNMEAAVEIARQIRLRDLGGIIVIDFIDMRNEEHRKNLLERFEQLLKRDRSRTQITEITSLGLVQMTRKRVRQSLARTLRQPCPYCRGEGTILSLETMVIMTLRRIEEQCRTRSPRKIEFHVHPRVARRIGEAYREDLERLAREHNTRITVRGDALLHFEEIDEGTTQSETIDLASVPLVEAAEEGTP